MTRQKVLLVVPYFPPHKGGMELFALNIAEHLSRQHEWEVVVVTTGEERKAEIEQMSTRLRVYRLPYWRKLSNSPISLSWFWHVGTIIRAENPELINIHTPVPGLGDIASLMAGRRPVIVNYHMGTMKKEKPDLNFIIWIYEHVLLKPMLHKARKIISSSDYVRNGFLGNFKHKTQTITPAVDSELFHPALVPVETPRIIFVGSLNKSDGHKNLRSLLAACKELRTVVPDLELTAVGDGDGRGIYQDLAADMGMEDVTTFTGWLERGALAEAYRGATVFALPTTNDSFPLVITEAMASGLPVVSTLVGGIPTLVDDDVDGLLVDPADSGALVRALRIILTDKKLASRLGEAGRNKAVRSLSWSSRAEMTDRVFREVLALCI
jgi:glycosyltransferase involved in cell wall biosynthesis